MHVLLVHRHLNLMVAKRKNHAKIHVFEFVLAGIVLSEGPGSSTMDTAKLRPLYCNGRHLRLRLDTSLTEEGDAHFRLIPAVSGDRNLTGSSVARPGQDATLTYRAPGNSLL
jgi:hypothetical protein